MVDLEASGKRYIEVDRTAYMIRLFHLDHSLDREFSFSQVPISEGTGYVMYVTEHLFDSDDGLEFLYFTDSGMGLRFTGVYNEDGTDLLAVYDEVPYVFTSFHQQHYPVYNTPEGAKLILSRTDGSAKVYGLGGMFTTGMLQEQEGHQPLGVSAMHVFPNPSSGRVRVESGLQVNPASSRLEIVDAQGSVVHVRSSIGSGPVELDLAHLSPGVYGLILRSGGAVVSQGEFVKTN